MYAALTLLREADFNCGAVHKQQRAYAALQVRRQEGHSEAMPPKWLLVPPQTKTVPPPKRGLCLKEINRLGAVEVQIEAWDSRFGVYCPRICEQEMSFRNFCGHTGFHKTFGTKTFFFFFWSSLENSWKIAKILRRLPEFVEIIVLKIFFFGFHLFRLIHTRINFSFPPPPQSRYPGAGPAAQLLPLVWVKCSESFRQFQWFTTAVLILRLQLQRYSTNSKRYLPKKVFGNSEFCSFRQKPQFSKLLGLLWFWREKQNSEFPKTFFGGYLFAFIEYLCNRSLKIKTKSIKNYSSILTIINHWNWLDDSTPLKLSISARDIRTCLLSGIVSSLYEMLKVRRKELVKRPCNHLSQLHL